MSAQPEELWFRPCCGAITGHGSDRKRCLEADPCHRGPHWSNAEPITCNCQYACLGHDR